MCYLNQELRVNQWLRVNQGLRVKRLRVKQGAPGAEVISVLT